MGSWADFESDAPELASFVAERLRAAPAYLATVDARGRPRVHPVSPIVGGGRLFVFMEATSPKGRDLRDRRGYAIHNSVPDNEGTGGECVLRGDGSFVNDPDIRQLAIAAAVYQPADRYVLFELAIDEVVTTTYEEGGPRRRRWTPEKVR